MAGGRPSDYTEETAQIILDRLADGEGLVRICRDDGMPARQTVARWLERNEDFRTRYQVARRLQADKFFEETIEIADDGRNDTYTEVDEKGNTVEKVDWDHIQRSKLRVQARQWAAGRLNPAQYGERGSIELTGKGGGPIHYAGIDAPRSETRQEWMDRVGEEPQKQGE